MNDTDHHHSRVQKNNTPIFFQSWSIYLCRELPLRTPPASSSRVGTPGSGDHSLSGSDGYHNECGYPTAEHSERHTSQLATYTSPVQDAGQVPRTKDTESTVQLSQGCSHAPQQGCITLLLPQENPHTLPAHGTPCEQGNDTATDGNHRVNG